MRRVAEALRRSRRGEPVTPQIRALMRYLHSTELRPAPVIETDANAIVLDLGSNSEFLAGLPEGSGAEWLTAGIRRQMQAADTAFAYGRYGEPRALYDNDHFAGDAGGSGERRTVHMGIDLFCAAGTIIRAPLDGVVQLVANNERELDYGPMLVLRHDSGYGQSLHTLYGHLLLSSVRELTAGQRVAAGDPIAAVGRPPENGNWPPHLHFQLILDLLDLGSDFPGVCRASERDLWLSLSPSPAMFFPTVPADRLDFGSASPVR
jgi:murein DD-endopeptidase MepM/ murein hydrolase activator NlpD